MIRLSLADLDELRLTLDDLLASGAIQPSDSPWGAPVLFVLKKDGTKRMVIDYRALNSKTVKDVYPLPRIDDLLFRLKDAKIFSTLDLCSGYHQIAMDPDSIPFTAFRTRYGSFEFKVMPFGLCNAPSTFMRTMNLVFGDLVDKFVLVYLDDILIFSSSVDEHKQHLQIVFDRLRAFGLL